MTERKPAGNANAPAVAVIAAPGPVAAPDPPPKAAPAIIAGTSPMTWAVLYANRLYHSSLPLGIRSGILPRVAKPATDICIPASRAWVKPKGLAVPSGPLLESTWL